MYENTEEDTDNGFDDVFFGDNVKVLKDQMTLYKENWKNTCPEGRFGENIRALIKRI